LENNTNVEADDTYKDCL